MKKENGEETEFVCPLCSIKELIPTKIVEILDAGDQIGDISVPPKFDCKKCEEKMEPTYYVSVNGIVFEKRN